MFFCAGDANQGLHYGEGKREWENSSREIEFWVNGR